MILVPLSRRSRWLITPLWWGWAPPQGSLAYRRKLDGLRRHRVFALKAFPSGWVYVIISFVPTVFRIGNLRVVIYPNDHRPAHVHVIGNGCEATFYLNCPNGPVTLRENFGFTHPEINRIEDARHSLLVQEME